MFRWNRMLRNLFGSPFEKAESRRAKPTVKPHLEKLTDRILPSASSLPVVSVASPPSAPQVAAATSSLASTMDQLDHLIATLEQNVIGAYQALGQEASYVLYQLDHLLGITPNAPTQPLNTAMQQARSGSGSGSGAMPTDHEGSEIQPIISNTQNQPLSRKTQLAGSGSGTDSVGQSFVWEPMTGGDYLWSDPNNWSSHAVPQNGAPATFSGTYNSHCIVNTNTTQGTIYLENGFTAPIEIEGELNIPGYDDLDIPADNFNVNFLTPDAPMNVTGAVNKVITPGKWNVAAGGQFNVTGQTVINFGIGANLTQSSGSPINVTNGTLNFGDGKNSGQYSTFQLTNAAASISVGAQGSINFYQTATTLISATVAAAPVISNSGTVNLIGIQGGVVGTAIAVPLQNHGTLNTKGGIFSFQATDNNNNDLSMDAGSINMFDGSVITCTDQFTQTGGAFNINGAQAELKVITGAANFNGGTVNFTSASGYGTLTSFSIVFNGATLNMRIQANSSNSDLITVPGGSTVTIKGSSTIDVTLNGTETLGSSWTLIKSVNAITGDFKTVNLPGGVFEVFPVTTIWSCHYSD